MDRILPIGAIIEPLAVVFSVEENIQYLIYYGLLIGGSNMLLDPGVSPMIDCCKTRNDMWRKPQTKNDFFLPFGDDQ